MFTETDLVRVAKRENNNKRKYLVVNCLQAKHIPVEPHKTLAMFDALADLLADAYKNEKILVVGFAETATAIGARLAVKLNCLQMQTTREPIDGVEYLYFTESHSHATEQKLIKTDLDKIIGTIDRIIFAEDEVTTGNTIRKIIDIIRNSYPKKINFSVASLLNGMDDEARKIYEENNIKVHYLVKTDHSSYTQRAESYKGNGEYVTDFKSKAAPEFEEIEIKGYRNGRRLVMGSDYEKACEQLWNQIAAVTEIPEEKSVLVLGTEEFMYPAIYIAAQFEKRGHKTKCHATTRSPIAVSPEAEYPLHRRYSLRSVYDEERSTFVYDIGTYDKVFILTDAVNPSKAGINDLVNAVKAKNNSDITVIRWCE